MIAVDAAVIGTGRDPVPAQDVAAGRGAGGGRGQAAVSVAGGEGRGRGSAAGFGRAVGVSCTNLEIVYNRGYCCRPHPARCSSLARAEVSQSLLSPSVRGAGRGRILW